MHGSGAVSCSCSLLIRGLILPAIRQKLHLSPCADSRSRLFASFSAVGSLEARSMLSRWLIAAWLSGYSHAKRNNLIIDLESFEENVNKLTNYCYDEKNFKVPIMEAIVRVLGK